jgi:hypothetical protein
MSNASHKLLFVTFGCSLKKFFFHPPHRPHLSGLFLLLGVVMRVLKYLGYGLSVTVVLLSVSVLVVQRVSDGPLEPLQGGPFTAGEFIEKPVEDWSFVELRNTQFELVGFGMSRRASFIMLDGVAYVTCAWFYVEPSRRPQKNTSEPDLCV